MKIYVKGNNFATFQVDDSWVVTEDEIVETPIGPMLQSCTFTKEYEEKILEQERLQKILELKKQIQKYKEDVEQVELFGMERADFEEKKVLCKNIIKELKKLENEHKN